ncbi:hypothetical protein BDV41DRAFT_489239 [Aspergillus transmontanensis]|uniref:Uncharacterized protein n=1 Tax=Aspergillus transmontanensis TaxID=1034304 RepID=A0A5N6WA20_9EURO|nr:hypothetical protein BDV41DRAFT_489239 [Aspergillus transmontanensis]
MVRGFHGHKSPIRSRETTRTFRSVVDEIQVGTRKERDHRRMILIESLRATGRFRDFDLCSRPTGIRPLIFDASEFSYGRSGEIGSADIYNDRLIVMFQERDSKENSFVIFMELVPALDSRVRVQGNAGRFIIINHRVCAIVDPGQVRCLALLL